MNGAGPATATRSSLLRLARRLDQVDKGAALLQKKRDALVVQLFARVRPTVDARRRIEQQAAHAYRALVEALAASGRADLAALAWPSRDVRVETQAQDAAAAERVAPPATLVRGPAARAWVPGQYDASAAVAARAFEHLLELLLETAPEESAIRRLGRELAHTVRQVNVLERRVAVALRRSLQQVRRTLDEREREEAVRLRRVAARARSTR
jgi:V/A-type H+/Na+-transporting ATPase subunit D